VCEACFRELEAERQQQLREARQKAEVCTQCGDELSERSSWLCDRCLELQNQRKHKARRRARRYYNKWKEQGCVRCGYNACIDAIDAHHPDPNSKSHSPSEIRTIGEMKRELAKCIPLCKNCHTELHAHNDLLARV
jgi:hypothetical protein